MERTEWAPLADILAGAYPHDFKEAVLDSRLDAFYFALMVYPVEQVAPAIYQALRTVSKFLQPADVVSLIETPESTATSAWTEACAWATRVTLGPLYRGGQVIEPAPLEDKAALRAAESVGGAEAIRARTLDDEPAMRAHFFRAYGEAQTQIGRAKALEHLEAAKNPPAIAPRRPNVIGPVQLRDLSAGIGRPIPKGGEQ